MTMRRSAGSPDRPPLQGRVVVVSPHLDDAVLSLGASIARAAASGAQVKALTVFAYGPGDGVPAHHWDRACGFRTAAEAREMRRAEDARSCALVGATPEWLPFHDFGYEEPASDDELWAHIEPAMDGADTVLIPGFPLVVSDHLRLARLLLARRPRDVRIGLYAEQPYASWRAMSRGGRLSSTAGSTREALLNAARIALRTRSGRTLVRPVHMPELSDLLARPPAWQALPCGRRDRRAKRRAIKAHRSQVEGFGPLVLTRVALHERASGGESVAWLS